MPYIWSVIYINKNPIVRKFPLQIYSIDWQNFLKYWYCTYLLQIVNSSLKGKINRKKCISVPVIGDLTWQFYITFTQNYIQLRSCNLNSCNLKDDLNRTNFWVPWTYFSSCNSNFGFGVSEVNSNVSIWMP